VTHRRPPWGDERGQVGGIEALPLGFLVLIVGTLLVVNAWAVVDAKMTTASAAREAARAYVEAADAHEAAEAARTAASETVEGLGRDPSRLSLQQTAGSFSRCQRVRFETSYPVPAITLPWIGGRGEAFVVRSRHTEIVDPYRSGVPGEAICG
jgi:hypothetical protein